MIYELGAKDYENLALMDYTRNEKVSMFKKLKSNWENGA